MAGRPIKYFTEEDRKKAIQQSKNKHILNKEWRRPVCDNHDYKMVGKWRHLNTKKHKKIWKQLKMTILNAPQLTHKKIFI